MMMKAIFLKSGPLKTELGNIFRLAMPLLVGQLAIIGLSITDIILSGRAGTNDLAGVTLGATLFDLPMMFLVGIFVANSALAGKLLGAGDHRGISRQFHSSLWLALLVGVLAMLVVTGFRLMAVPIIDVLPAVKKVSSDYLLPMTAAALLLPFVLAYRTTFEGIGRPGIAMTFNVLGFLINIPLDYGLIHGLWGLPALGGAGCGWATLLVLALILVGETVYIRKTSTLKQFQFLDRIQKPQPEAIKNLFLFGAPIGAAILAEAGFFHLIPVLVARLGSTAVAGHAVAMSFDLVLFMVPLSLAQAITILVAKALGTGDRYRARFISFTGLGVAFFVALIQSGLLLLFRDKIASLYSTDSQVVALASSLLMVAAFIRIFDGLHICGTGALRAYGDTPSTLAISLVAFWLIGFPLCLLLAYGESAVLFFPVGVQGAWSAIAVAVVVASLLTLARLVFTTRVKVP